MVSGWHMGFIIASHPEHMLTESGCHLQSSPPSEALLGSSPASSFEQEMLRFMQVQPPDLLLT